MKVYGQLEVAQFETFTNAGKPAAASYAYRVIWISDLSQLYISDGSTWLSFIPTASSRLAAMYDIVIGSAAQVISGAATHSSWVSAASAAIAGNSIFVLGSQTWVESPTFTVQVKILGSGYSSYLNGTLTFTGNNCELNSIRLPAAANLVDSGTGNLLQAMT